MNREKLIACIEACKGAAVKCFGRPGIEKCKRACLACADACINLNAAYKNQPNLSELLKKCFDMCNVCAIECEKYSEIEQFKKCTEACRNCAEQFKVTKLAASPLT
jgi:hypothetical protein